MSADSRGDGPVGAFLAGRAVVSVHTVMGIGQAYAAGFWHLLRKRASLSTWDGETSPPIYLGLRTSPAPRRTISNPRLETSTQHPCRPLPEPNPTPLITLGLAVFQDNEEVDDWAPMLPSVHQALMGSRVFVPLLTLRFYDSEHCRTEPHLALLHSHWLDGRRSARILPVLWQTEPRDLTSEDCHEVVGQGPGVGPWNCAGLSSRRPGNHIGPNGTVQGAVRLLETQPPPGWSRDGAR